jgi:hypothetical protein
MTGSPRVGPRGAVDATAAQASPLRCRQAFGVEDDMRVIADLTDAEIEALKPCDVLSLIMRSAMRTGDLVLALDAASALAPYRHRTMMPKPWVDYSAGEGISNATTGNHDERKH